jgi:hypothetical protein
MSDMNTIQGLDFSDLDFLTDIGQDVEVINPDADMETVVLPPEGQKYVVTPRMLHLQGNESHFLKPNKNNKLQFIGVVWQIQAEGKPWHKSTVTTWPSVQLNRTTNTTEVDVILRAYGESGAGLTDAKKVKLLEPKFKAAQPLKIGIQWELQLRVEGEEKDAENKLNYKTLFRGMTKFPKVGDSYVAVNDISQLDQAMQDKIRALYEEALAATPSLGDVSVESIFRVKNYYPMSVA